MDTLAVATWRAAVIGRWAARILGTLLFLLFLALLFGEGPPNPFTLTNTERLQFLGILALFFGLVAAWKWEGAGGLMSVAGFALLVAISRTHLHMGGFWMPAVVGLAHAVCWERLHAGPPPGLRPWHLSGFAIALLLAPLAIFILLCANEIYFNPPLMTPTLHPSAALVGDWHTQDLLLSIHPDASVTGIVAGEPISKARIFYRRSWFGRLVHFNSEYMIVGQRDGELFAVGLWPRGPELYGSLSVKGQPRVIALSKQ